MPQVEHILDGFRTGRSTLDETAVALNRMRELGLVDEAQLQKDIERFVAAGDIAPEAVVKLSGKPKDSAPPADATVYRAAASIDDGINVSPASTAGLPRDTSGSSSAGWRKWASADSSGAPVGVGTVLRDRFVIEQAIGEGGMGLIFRARDRRREEAQDRHPFVAIKVLGEDFKSHPDSLMSLQREARRMQQLSHPNIASVYDFDRDGPHVYLVMELLEGESLDRILQRKDGVGLPLEQARAVLSGAGQALRHAHSRGLVHSDFKPANVFMTSGGDVKVIDFGIARIVKDSTQAGDAAQTVFDAGKLGAWTNAYASPEQMLDGATPDPRDDIYALGLVTYEILTGKHPFGRKSAIEARFRNMKLLPVPLLTERQNAVLASALHFDREHRLADAMELVRSLGKDADDGIVAIAGIRPQRPDEARPAVVANKGKFRTIALAVIGLAWLGFFAAYWNARERSDAPASSSGSAVNDPAPPGAQTPIAVPPVVAPPVAARAPKVAADRQHKQTSKVTDDDAKQATSEQAGAAGMAGASAEPAATARPEVTDSGQSAAPEQAAATEAPPKPALYRWVDATGTVQFGETPPPEFADSAVKVMDL